MSALLRAARATAVAAGMASVTLQGFAQSGQDFPSKPIRFVVPVGAGGVVDTTARVIAEKLANTWGRPVIVDNRGGATGAIALDSTAKAVPDGYTICMATASHSIISATHPKPPYDLAGDFAAVSQVTSLFLIAYNNPSLPVNSIKELIAYAKAQPGKLNYGAPGAGSLQHLAWELFIQRTGTRLVHVPYKQGAQAVSAALAGDVQVGFATLMTLRPHVSTGRLRALAITANKRSPAVPDLPTIAESGVPGYEVDQWLGVVTNARVPAAIIRRLNTGITEALKSSDVAQRLAADGSAPVGSSPEEFSAHIRADMAKWDKLAKDARLTLY